MTVEQVVVVGIATLVMIAAWHVDLVALRLFDAWLALRDLVRNP